MLIIQVYVNYSSFADLPFVGWEMLDAPYIEGLSMSWCISPSPTGEARWGLMPFSLSNQFLPFGKVRMGCPLGKVRMGCPFGKVMMGLRSGVADTRPMHHSASLFSIPAERGCWCGCPGFSRIPGSAPDTPQPRIRAVCQAATVSARV